jgi:virginiamycin A acetyltransferase
MRSSLLGAAIARMNRQPNARVLRLCVKIERGQMFSTTLRTVLHRYYGVEAGKYSYGSLLTPGYADRHTHIGNYVSIGPGVRRFGAAHPLDQPSMHPFTYNPSLGLVGADDDVDRTACDIGHDSWIGANSVILPRCSRIGIGAVIGAGALVTKDVPDFAIAVGSPARVVGYRLDQPQRDAYLAAAPWLLDPHQMLLTVKAIRDSIGETDT